VVRSMLTRCMHKIYYWQQWYQILQTTYVHWWRFIKKIKFGSDYLF
jgi:hypothetical protein